MKFIPSVLSTCVAVTLALNLSVSAAPPVKKGPVLRNTGTVDVRTGSTSLKLSQEFSAALTAETVKIVKVIPGRIVPGAKQLVFPISGGAVDLATTEAEVVHSGGISLVKGTTKVTLTDLVISTPDTTTPDTTGTDTTGTDTTGTDTTVTPVLPTVSALVVVNGSLQGRVPLFNLDVTTSGLTAPYSLPTNGKVVLKNVTLKLTPEGAAALNTALETTAFTSDTVVGTAVVNAITVKGSL